MNHDGLWNRRWTLTNALQLYNDVECLLSGFRVGKDLRQSPCLWQRVVVEKVVLSHILLEAPVDCDRFLGLEKVECS
jgi:hypothetical protein